MAEACQGLADISHAECFQAKLSEDLKRTLIRKKPLYKIENKETTERIN